MAENTPDKISVLHLEDSALDAELTAEMLREAGLDCRIERLVRLEDFKAALQQFPSNWPYDIVLADYKLPGYDGMLALNLLREKSPHMPFVLLSGALGEELAVELLRNGATDYVLKHNLQRLPLVVRRALDEHQARLREIQNQQELRRARDEAQKANSAKGHFLGRISHELRTPLNAILGYTQLMQSDPMTDEQKHCSDRILKAGEHLLQLINEVLDITRIESGVITVNIQPTSISETIERAVDLVRPLARERNVTIHIDGGPCDLFALVDPDRLAQVLINLLTNSVKYNHDQGHVYVECQEENPVSVRVIVRDTGIGIPPDKAERLFTAFDRLDLEKDSTIPGTGLGLTVSKALIEAMHGSIGVNATETGGTVFWIDLPATSQPPDAHKDCFGDDCEAPSVPTLPADCRIVLIEAHDNSRDFVERVFQRRNSVKMTHAASLAQAREILKGQSPDLIIMELNFPDGRGEDLIREIKSDPGNSAVPIVITTVDPSAQRKADVAALGVADYFIKPIKINQFLHVLTDHCLRARQMRPNVDR